MYPNELAQQVMDRIACIRSRDRREAAQQALIARLCDDLDGLSHDGFAHNVVDFILRKFERQQAEADGLADWKQREDAYAKGA